MVGPSGNGDSSSGEEDADPRWKAAIQSIAATTNGFLSTSTSTQTRNPITTVSTSGEQDDGDYQHEPQKPKHYQIKAQKVLEDMLEKTLVMVRDPVLVQDDEPMENEGGVRLFKHSPLGIVFDHVDELQGPKKRPKILPGRGINEKSKEFRNQLKSIAVDGVDILAAASDACQKSLARLEAKGAAAQGKAKKEEERVAELKRIRGERWLPSIAREMQKARTTSIDK